VSNNEEKVFVELKFVCRQIDSEWKSVFLVFSQSSCSSSCLSCCAFM